jgi:hypothetical protein
MSSNRGSLGAYADIIPRVDGFVGKPKWDEPTSYPPLPLTQEQIDREMKNVGLLVLMGLVPLLLAFVLLAKDADIILRGQQTTGMVVDFRRGPRGHAPVAAFVANGYEYRTRSDLYSRTPLFELGDEVSIRYLSSDPDQAVIAEPANLLFVPALLGGVGCLILLFAIGCGISAQRRAQKLRSCPA